MANLNPIRTVDDGEYIDFIIPKNFMDGLLYVTTKTELKKDGWLLDLIHVILLDGDPLLFQADPDVVKTMIGKCTKLCGLKFSLISTATRIKNGGELPPSEVSYTVTFKNEDDMIIDSFSLTSDNSNPTKFYTKITFKC
jgi:hypothetical protein